MKKVVVSSIFLATVVLFSCEKEEIKTNPEDSKDVTENLSESKALGNILEWHDNGDPEGVDGVDFGCWDSGVRCTYEAPVSPSVSEDLIDVIDVIDAGKSADIISTFQDNQSWLSDLIGADVVEKVIDGVYTVSTRGVFTEDENTYFLFSEMNKISEVRPVIEG